MIHGSCLCGAIKYEIDGPLEDMHNCHCSMCRKSHGAGFATYAEVQSKDLRFTAGTERLTRYRSSEHVERSFCSQCGSRLFFLFDGLPKKAWVAAGTFDDDPGMHPEAHIFFSSKAPWVEIHDELKRFDSYPT